MKSWDSEWDEIADLTPSRDQLGFPTSVLEHPFNMELGKADRRINPLSQGPLGPSPRELTISSDPKSLDKKMFTFADYHSRTSLSLLTPLLDQSLTKKASRSPP